jgi:hypothetical protein
LIGPGNKGEEIVFAVRSKKRRSREEYLLLE